MICRIVLAGLLLTLGACATAPVSSNYTKDFSFRTLRTFDWLPPDMGDANGREPADNRFDIITKNALRKEFTARFYRQQLLGMPDFWVSYRMGPLNHRAKDGKIDSDRDPGPLDVLDPLETPRLGPNDLMLEIIDPHTQRVIWRGWGENVIMANAPPMSKKSIKTVENAVQTILRSFPPR